MVLPTAPLPCQIHAAFHAYNNSAGEIYCSDMQATPRTEIAPVLTPHIYPAYTFMGGFQGKLTNTVLL